MAHRGGVLARGRPQHLGVGGATEPPTLAVDVERLGGLAGRHAEVPPAQLTQQPVAHPRLADLGPGAAHQHDPLRTHSRRPSARVIPPPPL